SKEWSALVDEMKQLVTAHGLNMNAPGMMLGPMLSVDAKTEMFIGENADQANQFLKREYRAPFVVPEIA
ncbi:MAG: gfo/Idh/MocA family oxidoreductase, partial [Pirellula sp.]